MSQLKTTVHILTECPGPVRPGNIQQFTLLTNQGVEWRSNIVLRYSIEEGPRICNILDCG